MRLVKITLWQKEADGDLSAATLSEISSTRPDFLCLPEYCNASRETRHQFDIASRFPQYRLTMVEISRRLQTTVIGGSAVEQVGDRYYNTCIVASRGKELGGYHKIHLFAREQGKGLATGNEYKVFEAGGVRFGVLICADVLYEESFLEMRQLRPKLIFIPTTSPFKPNDTLEQKLARDKEIFQRGAELSQAYVVKVCAVGTLFGGRLQGRSLVAAPWGILWRVSPEDEEKELIQAYELDLDQLRHWQTERQP